MTADERAQLLEDIRTNNSKRNDIYERARLSPEFDIRAAWEEVEDLDRSIYDRIKNSSPNS
jgi:hypothetical protein